MLRGANTRTNFFPRSPSPFSPSALPSKVTNLLLRRLNERNTSIPSSDINRTNQETEEVGDTQLDNYFNLGEYSADTSFISDSSNWDYASC